MGVKLSPLSNLKYSHLKLGTLGLQKYINFIHISISNYNRYMILVSKHTCLRSTITLDTFSSLYPHRPSWNPRWPPFKLFNNTNIECFSFESIMHVIVPKFVWKHYVIILIDKTNDWHPGTTCIGSSSANGVILAYTKLTNPFNMLAYRRHTIMMLASKYTFLTLANPMGTFSIFYSWRSSCKPIWPPQNLSFSLISM